MDQVSNLNNNSIETNTKIGNNTIKQATNSDKIEPPKNKISGEYQLANRKVVGGVLTGIGITGIIAGIAALAKVGAAGIVSGLAGLVGAAAAPWVAIAIAGTAVAALIALTVTGIYLLATKPDNKDPQKVDNNMIQAEKDGSTEKKELDEAKKKRIERFEAVLDDLMIQAEKGGSTKEEIERKIKNLKAKIDNLKEA